MEIKPISNVKAQNPNEKGNVKIQSRQNGIR
jgi:hypothetical protein